MAGLGVETEKTWLAGRYSQGDKNWWQVTKFVLESCHIGGDVINWGKLPRFILIRLNSIWNNTQTKRFDAKENQFLIIPWSKKLPLNWLGFCFWAFGVLCRVLYFVVSVSCIVYFGICVCPDQETFARSNGPQVLRETNGRPNLFFFLYLVSTHRFDQMLPNIWPHILCQRLDQILPKIGPNIAKDWTKYCQRLDQILQTSWPKLHYLCCLFNRLTAEKYTEGV